MLPGALLPPPLIRSALPLILLMGCVPRVDRGPAAAIEAERPAQVLAMPAVEGGDVYLEALVAAGSAYDPSGQEGLANLTAQAMGSAGAPFEVVVDREWVSLRLRCEASQAPSCVENFTAALLHPVFEPSAVDSLREQASWSVGEGAAIDTLALAREVLEGVLYDGHPYGHPIRGRTGSLEVLGPAQLVRFHSDHYQRSTLHIGIAGGYLPEHLDLLNAGLEGLRTRMAPELPLQAPLAVDGRQLMVIDAPAGGSHLLLGQAHGVARTHQDYLALHVGLAALGARHQAAARLMSRLCVAQSLCASATAHAEPYRSRASADAPEQGVLRRQPYSLVVLRDVPDGRMPDAARAVLTELEALVSSGVDEDELNRTRTALTDGLPMLNTGPGRALSYALQERATGAPIPYDAWPKALGQLTVEQVNKALEQHVHPGKLWMVITTAQPDALVDAIGLQRDHIWRVEAQGIFQ